MDCIAKDERTAKKDASNYPLTIERMGRQHLKETPKPDLNALDKQHLSDKAKPYSTKPYSTKPHGTEIVSATPMYSKVPRGSHDALLN